MKPIENWENVQASNFENLPAGGYVFVICGVEEKTSFNGKPFLEIKCDVAEGEYKGFANGNEMAMRKLKAYYGGKSDGLFKRFIECVTASNRNFKWNWDENTLVGKIFGAVLAEREYVKADGSIGVASEIHYLSTATADKIRKGDFKPIAIQKLDPSVIPYGNDNVTGTQVNDVECPF